MADTFRLLDNGVPLTVTLTKQSDGKAFDVSTATLRKFVFRKPGVATPIERTATLVNTGSNGKVQYVWAAGELDKVGIWKYQLYVTFSDKLLHSQAGTFTVEDILKK